MKRSWQYFVVIFAIVATLPGYAWGATKKPSTMAELSLYKETDRQQILEEGAKKEGKLTFYTSGIVGLAVRPILDAFQKKYPFIKVDIWRASGDQLVSRSLEEFRSGKHTFDTMESTQNNVLLLQQTGIITPFSSPNFSQLEEESLMKAAGGVYAAAFRSSGIGFGYNTNLLKKDQLPKTYQDLLNPRWKGKLALNGGGVGVSWAATICRNFSEDLLKKIARQDFTVHMISSQAVLDQVINGEYPASPTIVDSHVFGSKKKGAPVAWVPLEPVYVNLGQIVLARHAPNPHAALLFADFELSKEGAEIHRSVGYDNFRKDVPALEQRYKKYFGDDSTDAIKADFELFSRLFVKK